MHILHRILVKIPDAVSDMENCENEESIEAIRSYAESETEAYCGYAYDWRETDTAGRWSERYPINVLFARDDPEAFIQELEDIAENQRREICSCLGELKSTVGTDLEAIAAGLSRRCDIHAGSGSFSQMTAYYLHCIAAHLYGEYRCDSYFYNASEYTARLYPDDIEIVKETPEDWALVMFDYHY